MRISVSSFVLACSLAASAAAAPAKNPCEAPDDVAGVITALPEVANALKPGGRLDVLGVGSATMFGPEASLLPGALASLPPAAPGVPPAQLIVGDPSDQAFPRQMAKALQVAVPGVEVHVKVVGGRGLSAADMLGLLRTELAAHPYQLVIWQTGTVEAVRNVPPGEFAQVLSDGAEAVIAAHADLIFVDPQYSRFLQTNSNLDPYEQAFQQVAAMPGVLLFRRFDLMRAWVNDGQIDLERTPPQRPQARGRVAAPVPGRASRPRGPGWRPVLRSNTASRPQKPRLPPRIGTG